MSAFRAVLLGIAVLLGGAGVLVLALGFQGIGLAHRHEAHPIPDLRVVPDSSRLARGRHLLRVACAGCHAPSHGDVLSGGDRNLLAISGGRRWGMLEAPNLTPAGVIAPMSDGELSRAIREGVGRGGRPLLVHPASGRDGLSEDDLAAILTALRAEPGVARETAKRSLSPSLYVALGSHYVETSVTHPVPAAVPDAPPGMNADRGRYLSVVLACERCHGRALGGRGVSPLAPRGADLRAFATRHSLQVFDAVLRRGVAPDGRALDRERMPVTAFASLDDGEVGALYSYLQSLSAKR